MFGRLEAELDEGPWFAGRDFSLVDSAYGPVFRYFDVFDQIAEFGVLKDKPKAAAWRAALAERVSVRDAVVPDYSERLLTFLRDRRSAIARRIPPVKHPVG